MSVADHVVPGRCAHCGSARLTWTPQTIVDAIQRWAEEHGRQPGLNDWRYAAPAHPAVITVQKMFGTWSNGIAAAGFKPQKAFVRKWDKQSLIDSILDFLMANGKWPTVRDFNCNPALPAASTVREHFGTWSGGLVAAGRTHRLKGERRWVETERTAA